MINNITGQASHAIDKIVGRRKFQWNGLPLCLQFIESIDDDIAKVKHDKFSPQSDSNLTWAEITHPNST